MENSTAHLLTVRYSRGIDTIIVRFFMDGHEVDTVGNVTDAEVETAIAAEGRDIEGFSCYLA